MGIADTECYRTYNEASISEKERYKLIEDYEPLCVDMESAGVAHVCHVNDIPFLVIRSIFDSADEKGSESFEKNVEDAGKESMLSEIGHMIL